MSKPSKYKECDKMAKVSKESQKIGSFLDWLRNKKEFVISQYADNSDYDHCDCTRDDVLIPVNKTIEDWLAEYFKIDMKKVEKERRQMLEELHK